MATATDAPLTAFGKLLEEQGLSKIPKVGDLISGKVVSIARNEIRIDIPGFRTGVVRGKELFEIKTETALLKPGDAVEATVLELENESGHVELSLRFAGTRKLWDQLSELKNSRSTTEVTVLDANKGGLLVRFDRSSAFLPVSQLAPEHYPRVADGEKTKILEKLKSFVGAVLRVKVIDANEGENKIIVSEKAVWEDEQSAVLSAYKIGDAVEGTVSATTDFGAFVKFPAGADPANALEGLVHISEIAWQRIDHPKDLLKVGDAVKAQIIGIQGSKLFLSIKRLTDDPWKLVAERYHVGDAVKGKIIKANPFGFFVELDPEIHGLAHMSEISEKPVADASEIAKVGDTLEWKIISLDPAEHRLGLSLKALKMSPPTPASTSPEPEKSPEAPAPQS